MSKLKSTFSLYGALIIIFGMGIGLIVESNHSTTNPAQVVACTKALSMADQIMANWRLNVVVVAEAGKAALSGDFSSATSYLSDAQDQVTSINSKESDYQTQEKVCTG